MSKINRWTMQDANPKDVGFKISNFRFHRKFTQHDLALKLGVTASTVNNWEAGLRLPQIEKVEKLAKLMNITLAEFLYGKPEIFLLKELRSIVDILKSRKYSEEDILKIIGG